jgi:hypothetical protein
MGAERHIRLELIQYDNDKHVQNALTERKNGS